TEPARAVVTTEPTTLRTVVTTEATTVIPVAVEATTLRTVTAVAVETATLRTVTAVTVETATLRTVATVTVEATTLRAVVTAEAATVATAVIAVAERRTVIPTRTVVTVIATGTVVTVVGPAPTRPGLVASAVVRSTLGTAFGLVRHPRDSFCCFISTADWATSVPSRGVGAGLLAAHHLHCPACRERPRLGGSPGLPVSCKVRKTQKGRGPSESLGPRP
ncbi:hypothetical protein ACIQWA_08135, partial [Kitasatospora sp. NPDC098652]